jgi:hypothetical protein
MNHPLPAKEAVAGGGGSRMMGSGLHLGWLLFWTLLFSVVILLWCFDVDDDQRQGRQNREDAGVYILKIIGPCEAEQVDQGRDWHPKMTSLTSLL